MRRYDFALASYLTAPFLCPTRKYRLPIALRGTSASYPISSVYKTKLQRSSTPPLRFLSSKQSHRPSRDSLSLPPLSSEQRQIIDVLKTTRKNLKIISCAGSGKTTTILQIAAAAADDVKLGGVFAIVYNRSLLDDTKRRIKTVGLENKLQVSNYHSLGYQYYSSECMSDYGLRRVVEKDLPVLPGKILPEYDILVMDELQDMSPVYFRFILKFIDDCAKTRPVRWKPRIIVFGDERQAIYDFIKADSRFLTLADRPEVFGSVVPEGTGWDVIPNFVSYRLTPEIAAFINNQVLHAEGSKQMLPNPNIRKGIYPLPRYVICDTFSHPINEIRTLLDSGVQPGEILILAPSVRGGNSPILQLANELTLLEIPVTVSSSSSDYQESEKVKRGKIMITTYHQSKGIERCVVILYCCDNGALEKLILIHHCQNDFLPFINPKTLSKTCDVVRIAPLRVKEKKDKSTISEVTTVFRVTDLTRFVPDWVANECIKLLEFETISPPCVNLRIPSEIPIGNGLWECVADITGTAIPALCQWKGTLGQRPKIWAFDHIFNRLEKGHLNRFDKLHRYKILEIKHRRVDGTMNEADILYLAAVEHAVLSGIIYKVHGIPLNSFNWLSHKHADAICEILRKHIPAQEALYERSMAHKFEDIVIPGQTQGVEIIGKVDAVAWTERQFGIWELKWAGIGLRSESNLQLAVYAAIAECNNERYTNLECCYSLVGVRTGEVVRIKPKFPGAFKEIVRKLVEVQYLRESSQLTRMTDNEFLRLAARGHRPHLDANAKLKR